MHKTLREIATLIAGEVIGDDQVVITGFCGIKEAQEGDIVFLANPKYFPLAEKTKASAIIVPRHITVPGKNIIQTDNPSLAFTKIVSLSVGPGIEPIQGIHKTAVVASSVKMGRDVGVGACVVIEGHVTIGDGTTIHAGSYVGHHTVIGNGCLVYPNVTIREKITIGHRVTVHSGTVIGSDGFGYIDVQGTHVKIPQVGTVVVEDDVEIGANVTIDRARFDKTFIGRGTKIDNLVQIAHNVIIAENCIIVSQVGISGSTTIGKGAILAGQAGIVGHLTIGEGAIIAAQSGVSKSVPPHTQVWGFPARQHDKALEINAYTQRLPVYVKTIQELKKRVEALEEKLKGKSV